MSASSSTFRPPPAAAHSDGRRPGKATAAAPSSSWADVVRAPRAGPPTLSQRDIEAGWCVVKRRSKSSSAGPTTAISPPASARPIPRWLQGRCFCCLGLGHLKAACKEPRRCYRCWYPGHLERDCKEGSPSPKRAAPGTAAAATLAKAAPAQIATAKKGGAAPALTPARLAVKKGGAAPASARPADGQTTAPPQAVDYAPARPPRVPASVAAARLPAPTPVNSRRMEDLGAGDPFLRPEAGHGVLSWTPGMAELEQRLLGRVLVANVLTSRREISPAMVVEELGRSCGILHGNVRVEVTRPSDFLIYFARGEDCSAVLNRAGRFAVSGAQLSFRRWHRTVHARSSKITHVVRLAIEGLPAHAVEAEAIKQLLNKIGCQFIEWFEPVDACMTEVLAWSSDPSKIPKEFALDIPEPMQDRWREPEVDDADTFEALVSEAPPAPPAEKKCLTFDLLFRTPLAPCHVQALTALCNLEEKGVEGDGVC